MSFKRQTEKINILMVTNHYYPENFRINDVSYFFGDKNKTTVVTSRPNYPSGKFYDGYSKLKTKISNYLFVYRLPVIPRGGSGINRLLLNYISYFFSLNIFFIIQIITRRRYSHILVHHTSPPLLSIPPIIYQIFFPKTKMIFWELDVWPDSLSAINIISENGFVFNSISSLMQFIYGRYHTILVGSKSYFNVLKNRLDTDKLIYFPNWVESCYENFDKSIQPDINLPNGFNIIYTGNIGSAQGLSIVPDIVSSIDGVNFIFIGDGKCRKSLENSCRIKGVTSRVFFYGFRDVCSLPSIIAKCDLGFLSLKNSGVFQNTVPAKLQAYMAVGIPILGLIEGEGKDIINNSKSGIAINPDNLEEAIKSVKFFMSLDKNELKGFGFNGKRYYQSNFAFDLRVRDLLKLFR